MGDWISENSGKIVPIVAWIVFVIMLWYVVGPLEPNIDVKPLLDTSVSPPVDIYPLRVKWQFMALLLVSGIITIFLTITAFMRETVPRICTLPRQWSKITEDEKQKIGFPDIYNMHFMGTTLVPTNNPVQYIMKVPTTEGDWYILLDMAEDYKKRRESPIAGYLPPREVVGFAKANSMLYKHQQGMNNFIKEAEKYGIKPENVRRDAMLKSWKEKQEEERRMERAASEGDVE